MSNPTAFDPMLTVAYLANQYPAAVEPYVGEEIEKLRRRGVRVIPGSVRKPGAAQRESAQALAEPEILYLEPLRLSILLRAFGLAAHRWKEIAGLVARVLQGKESPKRRLKALLHTWLGAYYAVLLRERGVDHIHVHHGYFGSWVAMVAARLLGVSYSLTLHGSDLLVNAAYLDVKLESCRFCITISEFNRRYIFEHVLGIDPAKIVVSRLGVQLPEFENLPRKLCNAHHRLTLLAVGRLHAVKDHAFLVRACARLRDRGLDFKCWIAGEGPERQRLETLIRQYRLQDCVTLLGHIPREQMDFFYRRADAVVLTSRSEGIPLVLMEAMVRSRIVIAPAITGIPEIIIPGKTGFLYAPGKLEGLVAQLLFIEELMGTERSSGVSRLDWIRHAAWVQITHNFNHEKNLNQFAGQFLKLVGTKNFASPDWSPPHEDLVLQQI